MTVAIGNCGYVLHHPGTIDQASGLMSVQLTVTWKPKFETLKFLAWSVCISSIGLPSLLAQSATLGAKMLFSCPEISFHNFKCTSQVDADVVDHYSAH